MTREHWLKVGRVMVDPGNPLAVGIVKAGAAAGDVFHTRTGPRDEVDTVAQAVSKRDRKNAKRLKDAQRREVQS